MDALAALPLEAEVGVGGAQLPGPGKRGLAQPAVGEFGKRGIQRAHRAKSTDCPFGLGVVDGSAGLPAAAIRATSCRGPRTT